MILSLQELQGQVKRQWRFTILLLIGSSGIH
jgi:hypothetical protein